jgi:hypothetical protein
MTTTTEDLADGAIADVGATYVLGLSASETATATDATSFEFVGGSGNISSSAVATALATAYTTYHMGVADSAHATDRATLVLGAAVTVSAHATAVTNAYLATSQQATAHATFSATPSVTFNVHLDFTATATDGVDNRSAVALSDTATASDSTSYAYTGNVAINVSAHATAQENHQYVLNQHLDFSAVATAAASTVQTFSVEVCENAHAIDAATPNTGVTTWVINTRTNAITQYRNFEFNSFASLGRQFIAASDEGLVVLQGAQDDAAPVVGDFAGGYFEPNPGKNATFKGAYFAARGQGRWHMELKAGDGREYVYEKTSNPQLMTTKIDIGKGLYARFWTWRMCAYDGQDFDFAGLELVPGVSGRRVG